MSPLEAYPKDRPISFAVFGDTLGSGTGEHILELLRHRDLDFIVHLGDFVSEPTWEGHGFFVRQVARGLGPGASPLLAVMGNHEVDAETFPVSAFESVYGPSSFAFHCAGNLFVVLRNALPPKIEPRQRWQRELGRLISEGRKGARRVFVFMHKPPIDPVRNMDDLDVERFRQRWGGLGVDYLISGHLHGYGRRQIGGTVVLVSAGGGARLKPHRSGMFHHAVVIRATRDKVTEEIIPVAPHPDVAHKAERFLFTAVVPDLGRVLEVLGVRRDVTPALAWPSAPKEADTVGS